jgi:hypothetical protein
MSKQFVIQLSHTPGSLAALCRELEKRAVDLKAIGGGGVGEHGHVILKTADDAATREVLKAGNYEFIEGDSVLAEVDDKPGGMQRLRPPLHRPLGRSRHLLIRCG